MIRFLISAVYKSNSRDYVIPRWSTELSDSFHRQFYCSPGSYISLTKLQSFISFHSTSDHHRHSKCKTFGQTVSLSNRTKIPIGHLTPSSRNPIMVSTTLDQHPCQVSRALRRWTTPAGAAGLRWPTRNVSPRATAAPPHSRCSARPGAAGETAPPASPAASRAASAPRSGARWWTRSYWRRWMPSKRISGTFPTNLLYFSFLYYLTVHTIYKYDINNSLLIKQIWTETFYDIISYYVSKNIWSSDNYAMTDTNNNNISSRRQIVCI